MLFQSSDGYYKARTCRGDPAAWWIWIVLLPWRPSLKIVLTSTRLVWAMVASPDVSLDLDGKSGTPGPCGSLCPIGPSRRSSRCWSQHQPLPNRLQPHPPVPVCPLIKAQAGKTVWGLDKSYEACQPGWQPVHFPSPTCEPKGQMKVCYCAMIFLMP